MKLFDASHLEAELAPWLRLWWQRWALAYLELEWYRLAGGPPPSWFTRDRRWSPAGRN